MIAADERQIEGTNEFGLFSCGIHGGGSKLSPGSSTHRTVTRARAFLIADRDASSAEFWSLPTRCMSVDAKSRAASWLSVPEHATAAEQSRLEQVLENLGTDSFVIAIQIEGTGFLKHMVHRATIAREIDWIVGID